MVKKRKGVAAKGGVGGTGKTKTGVNALTEEEIEEIEREIAQFNFETKSLEGRSAKDKDKNEKQKKHKKLNKKEKARLAVHQAEDLRRAAEDERQKWQKEEAARQERELVILEEKTKKDLEEQAVRDLQLEETNKVISEQRRIMFQFDLEVREKEEWKQYLKCDGLPDPASISEMNCYLFKWQLELEGCSIERAVTQTPEVIAMLKVIAELIDFPLDNPPSRVADWKEVRNAVRREQQLQLDEATYRLLRHMEDSLELTELNTMRINVRSPHFVFYMWSLLPLPIPGEPREDNMGHTSECEFSDLGIYIHMPKPLADKYLAIRAIWLKYDHLSDLCPSFDPPPIPSEYSADFFTASADEVMRKANKRIQYEENIKQRNLKRTACLLPFGSPGGPVWTVPLIDLTRFLNTPLSQYLPPLIPFALYRHIPTPAEAICTEEDAGEIELKKNLLYSPALHELNLRRYMILGGVFHLNLLHLPPQPKILCKKYVMTTLDVPPQLALESFYENYVPPPPPEAGVRRLPEEIELELKQQEAALDKLCLVTLTLPTNVLWFEPPIVVGWDPIKAYWSTEDCHDLKFNEEKQTVQFRTGRLGPFGLAVYRYTNLPYQGWEIKPDRRTGGVSISISATIAVVDFVVKEDLVCLSLLQNGGSAALQKLIGVFMKPRKLVRLLIDGGVDIFPLHDAFCYVEGVTSKHRPCEDHLYYCIALCGTAYNFAWSRWNLLAGYRNIVLQMREYIDRKKLPPYSMLHVTPQRALIVDCTEVGQVFSEEGVPGMKFYADLYHLVQEHSAIITKQKLTDQSFKMTATVYEMLHRIKPLSFS